MWLLTSLTSHAQSPEWIVRIEPDGWYDARPEDVHKVVVSAGNTLLEYGDALNLVPIVLKNNPRGPLVFNRMSAQDNYTVLVNVTGRQWSQLAYQFSHELCHILSNFDTSSNNANQWFEEAVCEGASLHALKRMSKEWQIDPPYPNWRSYAFSLSKYLHQYLQEDHRYLPAGTDLSEWYAKERRSLRRDHRQRHKNEIVGTKIFNYFQENQTRWRSIRYLNLSRSSDLSLQQYLQVWHQHLPRRLKYVAIEIASWFGYRVDDRSSRVFRLPWLNFNQIVGQHVLLDLSGGKVCFQRITAALDSVQKTFGKSSVSRINNHIRDDLFPVVNRNLFVDTFVG